MSTGAHSCQACGKSTALLCGCCKHVAYCSKRCQQHDWHLFHSLESADHDLLETSLEARANVHYLRHQAHINWPVEASAVPTAEGTGDTVPISLSAEDSGPDDSESCPVPPPDDPDKKDHVPEEQHTVDPHWEDALTGKERDVYDYLTKGIATEQALGVDLARYENWMVTKLSEVTGNPIDIRRILQLRTNKLVAIEQMLESMENGQANTGEAAAVFDAAVTSMDDIMFEHAGLITRAVGLNLSRATEDMQEKKLYGVFETELDEAVQQLIAALLRDQCQDAGVTIGNPVRRGVPAGGRRRAGSVSGPPISQEDEEAHGSICGAAISGWVALTGRTGRKAATLVSNIKGAYDKSKLRMRVAGVFTSLASVLLILLFATLMFKVFFSSIQDAYNGPDVINANATVISTVVNGTTHDFNRETYSDTMSGIQQTQAALTSMYEGVQDVASLKSVVADKNFLRDIVQDYISPDFTGADFEYIREALDNHVSTLQTATELDAETIRNGIKQAGIADSALKTLTDGTADDIESAIATVKNALFNVGYSRSMPNYDNRELMTAFGQIDNITNAMANLNTTLTAAAIKNIDPSATMKSIDEYGAVKDSAPVFFEWLETQRAAGFLTHDAVRGNTAHGFVRAEQILGTSVDAEDPVAYLLVAARAATGLAFGNQEMIVALMYAHNSMVDYFTYEAALAASVISLFSAARLVSRTIYHFLDNRMTLYTHQHPERRWWFQRMFDPPVVLTTQAELDALTTMSPFSRALGDVFSVEAIVNDTAFISAVSMAAFLFRQHDFFSHMFTIVDGTIQAAAFSTAFSLGSMFVGSISVTRLINSMPIQDMILKIKQTVPDVTFESVNEMRRAVANFVHLFGDQNIALSAQQQQQLQLQQLQQQQLRQQQQQQHQPRRRSNVIRRLPISRGGPLVGGPLIGEPWFNATMLQEQGHEIIAEYQYPFLAATAMLTIGSWGVSRISRVMKKTLHISLGELVDTVQQNGLHLALNITRGLAFDLKQKFKLVPVGIYAGLAMTVAWRLYYSEYYQDFPVDNYVEQWKSMDLKTARATPYLNSQRQETISFPENFDTTLRHMLDLGEAFDVHHEGSVSVEDWSAMLADARDKVFEAVKDNPVLTNTFRSMLEQSTPQ